MERKLMPVGTEIEVFDPEGEPDDMPIYSGDVESAHMSLTFGLYPATELIGMEDAEVERWLLIVSPTGESFAVSSSSEDHLDVIWQIAPDV